MGIDSNIKAKNPNPFKKEKKNIRIQGRRTSMSFEAYIWEQLDRLVKEEGIDLDEICSEIDKNRPKNLNLSTVIRYVVLTIAMMRESTPAGGGFEMRQDIAPFPSLLHTVLANISQLKN